MLCFASNTAVWISAISTLGIGIIGIVFTAGQWWLSGFQPKCSAEVEPHGDAIRILIKNRGRGVGLINRVVVVNDDLTAVDWARGPAFELTGTRLPALDRMEVVINAPESEKFTGRHRVLIQWGKKSVVKELTPVDVGLYGLPSLLPPQ